LKRQTFPNATPPLALVALALIFQACAPAAPSVGHGKVATPANTPRPDANIDPELSRG